MSVNLSLLAGAGWQFFTDDGVPLAGGLLYTYAAGTTTPQTTYTSSSGSTAHANPIVLNSAGRVATGEVWLTNGYSYKFLLKDASNVQIASYDNIPGTSSNLPIINDASSIAYEQGYTVTAGSFVVGDIYLITSVGTTNFIAIGASANTVGVHFTATGVGAGTGTAQLSQTVETALRHTVYVTDFGATGDGVTDDYPAVQAAIDYLRLANNLSSTNRISFYNQVPFRLHFPAGKYMLSKPLVFDFIVNLEGETTADYGNGNAATLLQFTATTAGLVFLWSVPGAFPIYDYTINKITSLSATAGTPGQILNGSPATGNALWSKVQNLTVQGTGSGTSTTTFVGVGSITAGVLTISAVTSGALTVGSELIGNNCFAGTFISSFGTGTGGVGTYNLNYPTAGTAGASTFYGYSGNSFSGIESRVSLTLDSVTVSYFHGNGINVYASNTTAIANIYGGANGFNYQNVASSFNDGHGFFISGGDGNTGSSSMCQFVNNKGWGIFDSSSLGNTYIGGQCSYNPLGSCGSFYDTGKTIFLNVYSEDGVKHVGRDALAIGGNSLGGYEGYINGAVPSVIAAAGGIQQSATLFRRYGQTPNETSVGIAQNAGDVFRIYDKNFIPSGQETVLGYVSSVGGYGACLSLQMAPSVLFLAPAPTSTGAAAKYGTSTVIPYQMTMNSLALPYRRITQESAAPVAGEYAQGDVVYNIAPTAGGYVGWVCVTAGTPGTWKTFGAISA